MVVTEHCPWNILRVQLIVSHLCLKTFALTVGVSPVSLLANQILNHWMNFSQTLRKSLLAEQLQLINCWSHSHSGWLPQHINLRLHKKTYSYWDEVWCGSCWQSSTTCTKGFQITQDIAEDVFKVRPKQLQLGCFSAWDDLCLKPWHQKQRMMWIPSLIARQFIYLFMASDCKIKKAD